MINRKKVVVFFDDKNLILTTPEFSSTDQYKEWEEKYNSDVIIGEFSDGDLKSVVLKSDKSMANITKTLMEERLNVYAHVETILPCISLNFFPDSSRDWSLIANVKLQKIENIFQIIGFRSKESEK